MPNRQFYFLVKRDYKIANSKLKASEVKKINYYYYFFKCLISLISLFSSGLFYNLLKKIHPFSNGLTL